MSPNQIIWGPGDGWAARLAWRRWWGQAERALDRLGGATQRQPGARVRVDEALAGNQGLQNYVQRLDSGLVDEDQEPPDELHYLTEDGLPSEIPSSDVALRELEEFLRQHQQA